MGKLAIYKPSRHKHQWFGVCLCPPDKFRSNHAINPVLVSTWNRHKISQYTHVKYSNTSTSYYVHWVCRPALAQTDIIKANRVNHTTYAELKDGKKKGEVCLFFGSELLKMTYRQTTSASKVFLEMALDTYLYSYFERLKKPFHGNSWLYLQHPDCRLWSSL